jgi:hypothetical protein
MPTLIAVTTRIAAVPVAALMAVGAALFAPATASAAAPTPAEVFIEVIPSTVEAGGRISLRASCPSNNESATARSDAFGTATLEPQYGFLVANVTIAATRDARSYPVQMTCPTEQTATATLHVVRAGQPTQGPATGFGGMAGGGSGGLLIGVGLVAIAGGLALGVLSLRRRHVAG